MSESIRNLFNFCDVLFYDVIFMSMNIQTINNEIIWEENDLTEPKKNCLVSNDNVPSDITNGTKTNSTQNLCDDIGKNEKRRLQLNAANRTWYHKTKTKRNEYSRKYHKKWRLKNKEHLRELRKNYRLKNKNVIREYHAKYCNNRRKNDVLFKISCGLRNRIGTAIKGNWKSGSAVRDLGCSIEDFKKYIEPKFQLGMSWSNYGKWHLDHIIPLSSFDLKNKEQFLKACHYTNYQPLWKLDNLQKSNRLISLHTSFQTQGSV